VRSVHGSFLSFESLFLCKFRAIVNFRKLIKKGSAMNKVLSVLFLLFLFTSCSKNEQAKVDQTSKKLHGEWVSDRSYKNDSFGFKITIPEKWDLKKGHDEQLNEMGSDLVAGNNQNMKNALKTAALRSHKVLSAFRYPLGTPGKTNPNVQIVIENIGSAPGIKSCKDYMKVVEQNISMGQLKVDFKNDGKDIKIGNSTFYQCTSSIDYGNMNIKQVYYSKIVDRHIFFVNITTIGKADEKIMEPVIKSMFE